MTEEASKTGFTDLIHWKNPAVSGVALAVFDIGLFVISRVMTNLSTFSCSIGMLAIFAGGAFKFASPPAGKPLDIISEDQCKAIADNLATCLHFVQAKVRDIVLWSEDKTTIKALVCLEFARHLVPWLNFTIVAFLLGNGLMTLPFLYHKYQDTIDGKVQPLYQQAIGKYGELKSKIPKFDESMAKES